MMRMVKRWLGLDAEPPFPTDWEIDALIADLLRVADYYGRRGAHVAFNHFEWLALHVEGEFRAALDASPPVSA